MTSVLVLSAAATLLVLAHSPGAASGLVVTDAHIRPIPATLPMTAGYFTVRNTTAKPDTLVSVKCACAADVSAHETDEKGGVSSMQPSGAVAIPARASVTFAPGGRHLMLMGVKGGVRPGARVRMTFTFARAGEIVVPFVGRN